MSIVFQNIVGVALMRRFNHAYRRILWGSYKLSSRFGEPGKNLHPFFFHVMSSVGAVIEVLI